MVSVAESVSILTLFPMSSLWQLYQPVLLLPQFHLVWAAVAISNRTEKAKLAKLKATELLLLAMEHLLFFRPTLTALLDLAVLADWVV